MWRNLRLQVSVLVGALFGALLAFLCDLSGAAVVFAFYGGLIGLLVLVFSQNIVSFDFGQLKKRDEMARDKMEGPFHSAVPAEGDVLVAAPTKPLALLCAIPMASFFFALMVLIVRNARIAE